MKITALMFLVFVLGKGCNDEEKQQDIKTAAIEYTANTRGFYQKITVADGKIFVNRDRNKESQPVEIKVSDADRKELIGGFQEITLADLPNLKAPTEKRFYDGAAIANLKIIYQGKTYQSPAFDHGNPPVEIEKLVDKLVSLAKE